jgi:uncharacterized protein YjbJ (UPF0337 family)
MNADQRIGKWKQFKGEFKQKYGKFTDSPLQQIEGIDLAILGKVQERYGNEKNKGMNGASRVQLKSQTKRSGDD